MDQADMSKKIGVVEVREAILATGQSSFTAEDIADQMDVDSREDMKAIWKALGYMTGISELKKLDDAKPSRWKVIRLHTEGKEVKHEGMALFGAMLGWKPK
jgi:hypothetical protein